MTPISPSAASYVVPVTCRRSASTSLSVVDVCTGSPMRSPVRSILFKGHTRTPSTSQKTVRIANKKELIFIPKNEENTSMKFFNHLMNCTARCVQAKTKAERDQYKKSFSESEREMIEFMHRMPAMQKETISKVSDWVVKDSVEWKKKDHSLQPESDVAGVQQIISDLLQISDDKTTAQLTDIPVKVSTGCHCVIM